MGDNGRYDDVWLEGYHAAVADEDVNWRGFFRIIDAEYQEALGECTRLYDQILVLKRQLDLQTPEGTED